MSGLKRSLAVLNLTGLPPEYLAAVVDANRGGAALRDERTYAETVRSGLVSPIGRSSSLFSPKASSTESSWNNSPTLDL